MEKETRILNSILINALRRVACSTAPEIQTTLTLELRFHGQGASQLRLGHLEVKRVGNSVPGQDWVNGPGQAQSVKRSLHATVNGLRKKAMASLRTE